MNIEQIMDLWKEDSNIDKTELGDEALKTPILHSKYMNILIRERLLLRKLESEMKELKLDKNEFFTQGPNEETKDKGWRLPPRGMILKSDIPMYMDADKEIINLNLKIAAQSAKIEFLESVIKVIINRGYIIKTALDWQRFTMGV